MTQGVDSASPDVRGLQEQVARLEAALRARDRDEIQQGHALKLAALGQLTAGVAHELNTPLQFITDNLHFLRDSVHGLLVYVETLRLVREAAGTGSIHPELLRDADTAAVIADVDFLLPRFERSFTRTFAGLERITTIDDRAARVVGRRSELEQVLINLVKNAIEAIEDAGGKAGKVSVEVRGGTEVEVVVRDNGGGIPSHRLETIFTPFFTTKAPGRGTGLGLLVVKQLVEAHRGTITVASEVGQGTAFLVRLPA